MALLRESEARHLILHGHARRRRPEILQRHNLTPDEYERIVAALGREPNLTELGLFSVMWSEHCSYKSSRIHLKTLPTEGPRVLQGPGENAGAVDIGDGLAAVFKIESHNHPSFIEPYQGAATGVGGILRDIFTMGARPIAILNSLRFGPPDDPRNRRILEGVVAGIGGYGNAFGCPTVGGEVVFEDCYAANPLVNAFCLGIVKADAHLHGPRGRRRQHRLLRGRQDRPRRHPRRHHGLRRVRRGQRGEAAHGAGRRPVHGEGAARGLPGGAGRRAPWSASRTWARPASPAPPPRWAARAGTGIEIDVAARAQARDGHDRLRGDAVRVAGADAAGGREGARGRGHRASSRSGTCTPRPSAPSPRTAACACSTTAGWRRTSPTRR